MSPKKGETIRVACIGDIHVRETITPEQASLFQEMCNNADVLALCGDLTNRGTPEEASALVEVLAQCKIPIVAVLGNHDFECGQQDEVKRILEAAGISVLEGQPCEIQGVGFAGAKGFCGGFERHMLEPWGEDVIKAFVRETVEDTLRLEGSLARLRTERRLAVLHYAPIRTTVEGEPVEIFPFLGSSRLAEPIDRFGVAAVVHGHAHRGTHQGQTRAGIPVYNVSLPLMRQVSPERPYLIIDV